MQPAGQQGGALTFSINPDNKNMPKNSAAKKFRLQFAADCV
jgi:hypothetical protein